MLCLHVISLLLILCAESIVGDSSGKDLMPSQKLHNCDENSDKMSSEISELKASMEILKVRSESQESFNNDLLNVLRNIDSKLGDKSKKESLLQRYSSCAEALSETHRSGIYKLILRNYREPFPVYCENNIFGGNWTVIQRRLDGSVDFFRDWNDYQTGFGDLTGEFFIGLDKLYALTSESPQELLIELEDFDNEMRYAKYDAFAIGDESEDYTLNVLGSYSGSAGDSLTYHKSKKFATKDRDNDNCANNQRGAWWYNSCHYSNLNGVYRNTAYGTGINWKDWRGYEYSYKRVQMLIRPKIS